MQRRITEIHEAGGEIIGLSSRGDRNDVERVRRELGVSFPLIPAPVRDVADGDGVWNHQKNASFGTVIIGKTGIVRLQRLGQDEQDRPSVIDLVSTLRTIR